MMKDSSNFIKSLNRLLTTVHGGGGESYTEIYTNTTAVSLLQSRPQESVVEGQSRKFSQSRRLRPKNASKVLWNGWMLEALELSVGPQCPRCMGPNFLGDTLNGVFMEGSTGFWKYGNDDSDDD